MLLLRLSICDERKDNAAAAVGLIKQFDQMYTLLKSAGFYNRLNNNVIFTQQFFFFF